LIRAANDTLLVRGDLGAIGQFFAVDYLAHVTEHDARGHALVRGVVEAYRRAFPDLTVDVQVLVEADDRVAWARTVRATHRAAYKGFPATGRPIVWRDVVTSRIEAGLVAEEWVISDLAERLLLARKR
jgi:steroid delta-isomerase-like uncharacterized protein